MGDLRRRHYPGGEEQRIKEMETESVQRPHSRMGKQDNNSGMQRS